ncbi:MAG: Bax protein [Paraglaciecola sp.]|jgi:Bax protein
MPDKKNTYQNWRYLGAAILIFCVMLVADNYFDSPRPDDGLGLSETELTVLIDELDRSKIDRDHTVNQIPDFTRFSSVIEKKRAFFAYLLPEIDRQNEITLTLRKAIHAMQSQIAVEQPLTPFAKRLLTRLRKSYRVDENLDNKHALVVLSIRVDIIPPELVLVQAANESGWGTSRFARKGYNFFGLWCFTKGCGFIPRQRDEGTVHEVAKFSSLSNAVKTYIRNLNRHYAYQELREIRSQLRQQNKPVTARALVHGLHSYSERGQDYIDELVSMMRVNEKHMNL